MAALEQQPFYKNATPEKQKKLRGIIYDKVLTPLAQKHNLGQLPNREAWINKDEKGVFSSLTPASAKMAFSTMHSAVGSAKAVVGAAHFVSGIDKKYLGETQLENYDKELTTWMDQHYSDSLKDRAIKFTGSLTGQLPAFELGEGLVGEVPFWNEKALEGMGKLGQFALKGLRDATNGALTGLMTGDSPTGSAIGFVGGGIGARTLGFVGRLLGIGGGKAAKEIVDETVKAVESKAPEVTAHPLITATAGKLKQKLTASMLLELNKVVEGGDFLKASPVAKAAALDKLGKLTAEVADHLAAVNGDIVKMQAAADLAQQRAANPAMNDILSKLEKSDGERTEDTITKYVTKAARAPKNGKQKARIIKAAQEEFLKTSRAMAAGHSSVGAASASSLEFEDNVSKLFPTSIKFEDRGHKFLAALNVLVENAKATGKTTPQEDEMFRALVHHLQERYPDKTLQEMMEAGENVWKKLGEIVKASDDASVRKWGLRFFRQSSVFPNEVQSPWKHEVELFTKSGKYAEEQGIAVGSRVRVGATKVTGEVLEVGPAMTKLRLPNNKVVHVSNQQLVPDSMNIVQAQEEILRRRGEK